MDNKERFIELLRGTGREGVENTIIHLGELGFFEAPASSRFHLNQPGGLLWHSLNVCKVAMGVRDMMIDMDSSLVDRLPEESVVIASLLHDTCKADIYRPATKVRKNKFGIWVPTPGYDVDHSNFPLGHGEKSVIVLLRAGLKLTDDEIMAIRWHMHAWDLPFQSPDIKGNMQKAREICPLTVLIQTADGLASAIIERSDTNTKEQIA